MFYLYGWACLDAWHDDYVLYSMPSCHDLFCVISILFVEHKLWIGVRHGLDA